MGRSFLHFVNEIRVCFVACQAMCLPHRFANDGMRSGKSQQKKRSCFFRTQFGLFLIYGWFSSLFSGWRIRSEKSILGAIFNRFVFIHKWNQKTNTQSKCVYIFSNVWYVSILSYSFWFGKNKLIDLKWRKTPKWHQSMQCSYGFQNVWCLYYHEWGGKKTGKIIGITSMNYDKVRLTHIQTFSWYFPVSLQQHQQKKQEKVENITTEDHRMGIENASIGYFTPKLYWMMFIKCVCSSSVHLSALKSYNQLFGVRETKKNGFNLIARYFSLQSHHQTVYF